MTIKYWFGKGNCIIKAKEILLRLVKKDLVIDLGLSLNL